MSTIGERLKEFRVKKGLTQQGMAEVFGVQKRGYIHYEQDERKVSPEQLIQIAHLGCDVHWLLTGEERVSPPETANAPVNQEHIELAALKEELRQSQEREKELIAALKQSQEQAARLQEQCAKQSEALINIALRSNLVAEQV